uniref:Uncharacterized protein n=1 Tax=Otolemur garnettii TaxID=30611 RepID=H0Y1Z0_OTOGA
QASSTSVETVGLLAELFFLYGGSKLEEEGSTQSWGLLSYPSWTLWTDFPVICCFSDLSGSPPTLICLQKLLFAIKIGGDCLWALGWAVFLDQLSGILNSYNGPVSLAYKNCSHEERSTTRGTFMEQMPREARALHKISSPWTLDHTKAEPLLLKAAFILQTGLHSPLVPAGRILYKGLDCSRRGCWHERGAALLPDVQTIPVFVTREESVSLCEFPVEQRTSQSPGQFSLTPSMGQPCILQRTEPFALEENVTGHVEPTAWMLVTTPQPMSPDEACPSGKRENSHLFRHDPESTEPRRQHSQGQGSWPSCSLVKELGCPQGELDLSELIPEAQEVGTSSHSFPFSKSVSGSEPMGPEGTAASSLLSPSLPEMQTQSGACLPGNSSQAPVLRGDLLCRRTSGSLSRPHLDSGQGGSKLLARSKGLGKLVQAGKPSGTSPSSTSPSAERCDSRMTPAGSHVGLMQMSLLAGEPLLGDGDGMATEEAKASPVSPQPSPGPASLLRLDRDAPSAEAASTSSTYNLTPSHGIQTAGDHLGDHHFLQAVSLIHLQAAQLPSLYAMTVRSISTAVYCCDPTWETYFQQLEPPARSCGSPNPRGSAFSSASKAKQKL